MEGTPLQLAPIWHSGWGKHNAMGRLSDRNNATPQCLWSGHKEGL